jgi:hypothetical protein
VFRDQRDFPVVDPERSPAGGGVWFCTVDPGIPLGPELLGTWAMFSHAKTAIVRMIAAAITAIVRKLIKPRS